MSAALFADLPRATPQGFPDLWVLWPKKSARVAAEKAYRNALRKPGVTAAFLIKRAREYAEASQLRDQSFILHMATWLNGERYDDDLSHELATVRAVVAAKASETALPDVISRVEQARAAFMERVLHEQ